MDIRFDGKVVLITGATGQLGRVMVRSFADSGANVAIHYHKNEVMANSLMDEAVKMGRKAMTVQADVTDQEEINRMADNVKQTLGMPDIVVNNAVIQYQWTSILEQATEDFHSQFLSCTMHNVYMAKAFLPEMINRKEGRFIGINTECAMLSNAYCGAYSSAKRGMDGLYRVLAKEVGPYGITVNQVAPGATISDRDRENGTEHIPEVEAAIPLRRRGTDIEIANVVIFLASDFASFITGAYIPVCGGNCMPAI